MILPRLSTSIPGGTAYRPLLAAQRTFPASSAAWSAAFPSITVPTSLWPCQETSGTVVDVITGNNLTAQGAGGSYANAGDPFGRTALGLTATNSRFQAANTTILDVTTGSISIFVRCYSPSGANAGAIVEKRAGDGGNDPGYQVIINSGEEIGFSVDGADAGIRTAEITGVNQADKWVDVMGVVDSGGGNIHCYTPHSNDTEPLAGTGSLTNSLAFCFGDPSGLHFVRGGLAWGRYHQRSIQFN